MNNQLQLPKELYTTNAIKQALKREKLDKKCSFQEKENCIEILFTIERTEIQNKLLKNLILATMVEEGMIP